MATGSLEYTASSYDVSALVSTAAITSTQMTTWEASVADKSTVQVSTMTYDPRGNLRTSQSFSSATTSGSGSDPSQTTNYIYDQTGELLSRTSSAGGAESFVYDGMGRVIASTDANGATTSIVFNDAATQTVVTTAVGLTTVSTYNKAGELVSQAETYGYTLTEVLPQYSDLNSSSWAVSNLTVVQNAGTIAGASANKYTVNSSGFDAFYTAGTSLNNVGTNTYGFDISLQSAGGQTTSQIAIYGTADYWGNDSDSTATIISGPGTLTRTAGGLWTIAGLSTTTATRVHIERTVSISEQVSARVMVGGSSAQAGDAVLLGSPQVTARAIVAPSERIQTATTSKYDQLGRLAVATDATNHNSYYIYDAVSRLERILFSLGHSRRS